MGVPVDGANTAISGLESASDLVIIPPAATTGERVAPGYAAARHRTNRPTSNRWRIEFRCMKTLPFRYVSMSRCCPTRRPSDEGGNSWL